MVRHMRIAAAVLIGAVVSSPVGLAAVSAFAVGIAVNAQQAQAQAFRFSNFVIEGNQRITDETIISYTGITPGAGVSAGEVNDALQSLQDSGLFERVELIPRGGTLEIRVLEYPTINRIAIEGQSPHRTTTICCRSCNPRHGASILRPPPNRTPPPSPRPIACRAA